MPIRIEVREDLTIDIMRICDGVVSKHLNYKDLESALIIIRYLLRRDLAQAEKDRYIPFATREARKAFEELKNKSPYNK